MKCPQCGLSNPPDVMVCTKCTTPLPVSDPNVTLTSTGTATAPDPDETITGGIAEESAATLGVGSVLAGRYEILRRLGEGGMGAVFTARDRELDRVVALKVVRPSLAKNPEILNRFKQELLLARQVTHRNVIRIYDLAESGGTKFITMDFIDGQDLKSLIRKKGKLAPEEAAGIIEQVCRALEAAHSEGVIHRDLTPQNIMIDHSGRVYVMDFGIARSTHSVGMTRTGALVGTPEYMSPEQARGEKLDARSDLFSLGIIFYELLTGSSPFPADTAMASLLKRTKERARPPTELDPSIPQSLSDVVLKCLGPNPQDRYQSAREIWEDLRPWRGSTSSRVAPVPVGWKLLQTTRWMWFAPSAVVLLVAAGSYLYWTKIHTAVQPAPRAISLLVADFQNGTSDPVFDGTFEPALTVALEGASFITSYHRGQARKIGVQLQPGTKVLDEPLARLVATRENINVVIAGAITRQGDGYNVRARIIDSLTGRVIFDSTENADSKQEVLAALSKLAARMRGALGDATPESAQIAAAETYTAGSLDAAHEYAVAQELQWTGKWDNAIQHYLKAVELDPNLGRAYAGLASTYNNIGRPQDAEKYFRLALSKIDRMSQREKYRTRGLYYTFARNTDKAIEELTLLVKEYPSDTAGVANLALAYFFRRDMQRALQEGRRAVELSPKNVPQRNNVGLFAMYASDFDTAIQEQQAVLTMNPSFVLAYVGMALSQVGKGRLAEAADTYHRLEKLGPLGASASSMGLADLALYEGRTSDAVHILEGGVAADIQNKNPDAAAIKWATLAQAYIQMGRKPQARAALTKALEASKELEVTYWAARVYLGLGEESKALGLARRLETQLGADSQAYAKLIEAEVVLQRGRPREAVQLLEQAQKLADTWLGRFDLGRAYLEVGSYPEAGSELELCLKRRGEATAAFLNEVPTYRLVPPVYYYLGRAQEGLQSPAAEQSYQMFITIKAKGEPDPLVTDARQRVRSR